MAVKILKISNAEIRIVFLLRGEAMNVRALRAEMRDYGSISRYLNHLEALGYIKRDRKKDMVMNSLTEKGEKLARTLAALRL